MSSDVRRKPADHKWSVNSRTVMAGAAAVVVLGAFLPWVSIFGYSKAGIDGDGSVTLVIALVGLLLAWRGWLGQLIAAALITGIGIYDLNGVGNLAAIGLYLTFLAGVVWMVASVASRKAVVAPPTVVASPNAGATAEPKTDDHA